VGVEWCRWLGCVCVSVEYRLAPEVPYPGPLDDCEEGLRFIVEHAHELQIDAQRVGVGGRSAGGALAAALALRWRAGADVPLAFQYLEYPMLDDRGLTVSSQLEGLPIWTRESNAFGWRSYLGDRYGTDDVPADAAPARVDELSGLPSTFIGVSTADCLRDESIDFAARLCRAGCPPNCTSTPERCTASTCSPTPRSPGPLRATAQTGWPANSADGGLLTSALDFPGEGPMPKNNSGQEF
jgi:acetyl esterase/lipase